MRPIEKTTLAALKCRLEEAREAEHQAVINVANSTPSIIEHKLDELKDARAIVLQLAMTIHRLERPDEV